MVLFEVGHLLAQGFVLDLQVRPAQGDLIQHPAQPIDIALYALVKRQLVFIPERELKIF